MDFKDFIDLMKYEDLCMDLTEDLSQTSIFQQSDQTIHGGKKANRLENNNYTTEHSLTHMTNSHLACKSLPLAYITPFALTPLAHPHQNKQTMQEFMSRLWIYFCKIEQ